MTAQPRFFVNRPGDAAARRVLELEARFYNDMVLLDHPERQVPHPALGLERHTIRSYPRKYLELLLTSVSLQVLKFDPADGGGVRAVY